MDTGLKGRTAVVPGASSGLGLAVARALGAEGANVVLGGRRGELVRGEAEKLPSAVGVEIDLTDPGAADALVAAALDHFGPVDVLVLNGGGPPPGLAVDFTPEQLTDAVALLVQPHQRLVRAVLPGMRGRGFGRIVAVGSSGVQAPLDRLVASNAARAALAGYLKTLATEVAADGVTVNMVLPGRIATDRLTSLDKATAERSGITPEQARAQSEATIPAGRYGTPDEFAAVVTFLASAAASYVTGEQIRCDGGLVRAH
jgi:3-oxoacyl-[acyl-carrier protein] reductase